MDTGILRSLKQVYFGPQAFTNEPEIRKALKEGRPYKQLYLITLSSNEKEELDIVPGFYIQSRKHRERLPEVVGLAIGRMEALELVGRIAALAYRETGACHLRQFLIEEDLKQGNG
ncbi:MAG: hypothetical protein HUJ73_05775 [Eubacterium sp.]|nr:hypothetical protein [Eubacterium sp.]